MILIKLKGTFYKRVGRPNNILYSNNILIKSSQPQIVLREGKVEEDYWAVDKNIKQITRVVYINAKMEEWSD